MADQSKLLARQSSVFANEGKPAVSRGGLSCLRAGKIEQPEADKLLEKTLNNNAEIAESLTGRETQILQMVVSGRTNKEIAIKICRTERTVEYHRNRLMRKLGAHNAADLVSRAITMGIV